MFHFLSKKYLFWFHYLCDYVSFFHVFFHCDCVNYFCTCPVARHPCTFSVLKFLINHICSWYLFVHHLIDLTLFLNENLNGGGVTPKRFSLRLVELLMFGNALGTRRLKIDRFVCVSLSVFFLHRNIL